MLLAESQSKQQCRIKTYSTYPEVEIVLYQWLNHHTMKSVKVTDKQIKEKARDECKRIYNLDWKPSSGWLNGFKTRLKRKDTFQSVVNTTVNSPLEIFTLSNSPCKHPSEKVNDRVAKWIEKIKV